MRSPRIDFLVRLEQLAPANVLKVEAHQVDVLAADMACGCRQRLVVLVVVLEVASRGSPEARRPPARRLRAGGRFDVGVSVFTIPVVDIETEFVSPVPPIEHLRLTGRVTPFDERPAAARRLWFEGERGRRGLGHVHRRLQGRCLLGAAW